MSYDMSICEIQSGIDPLIQLWASEQISCFN